MKIQGEPLVSILIPNKDHIDDLEKCLSSIYEKSTWKNYEILVVENNRRKARNNLSIIKIFPGVIQKQGCSPGKRDLIMPQSIICSKGCKGQLSVVPE